MARWPADIVLAEASAVSQGLAGFNNDLVGRGLKEIPGG
jgi:hypothetical protein